MNIYIEIFNTIQTQYKLNTMETDTAILFYSHGGQFGCLSNFYSCIFKENERQYVCSEQYLMKKKQELFDPDNNVLSNEIMTTHDPAKIKKLGRSVKNFSEHVWNQQKYYIMKNALRLKFSQNGHLKDILKNTAGKMLYEASPYDRIWGTGFDKSVTYAKILDGKSAELGENLLGKALMEIRQEL